MTRLPALDGLRALALLCVMAFHFVPPLEHVSALGSVGVRVFFVLSGFLITRILLASRSQALSVALPSFYLRRGLRILPVFYAVLAIAWLLNIGPVRQTIGWHVSYLTNVYLFERQAWHGSISHLWSLAVEQQFYLVWPFVILLTPERWLPAVIVLAIGLVPASRLVVGGPMNSVLATSCLDSLGAGALLAFPRLVRGSRRVGATVGIPLLIAAMALGMAGVDAVVCEVAFDFGVSLTAMWVVGAAAEGQAWPLLSWAPLTSIGTISYGAYLVHGFAPYLAGRYISGFMGMAWPLRAAILTTLTLVAAQASWAWLESPLLALKDRVGRREDLEQARAA